MLEEARELWNRGYSLIPLTGKRATILWEQYQTNRAPLETVENWFKDGGRNIAILTGKQSGIVCLDIDPKHGGSVSKYLDKYPTDCYVLTGGGGAHLYYQYPGHEVQNIQVEGKAVQWKGDGGYVVAPPSIHPDTGKTYRWINRGDPAPFPEDLYQNSGDTLEPEGNWISSLLAFGAADGEKNNSLTSITGYFASKEIPQDITLEVARLWNQRNQTKIEFKELETTVKSVYKTAKRRIKLEPYIPPSTEGFVGPKAFRLQKFEEFMRDHADNPVDWIVPGWLPDKTINLVVSPPEHYKTWLLFDLAVSVAMGGKFLGMFPVKMTGPVILIQQEDFAGSTAQRVEVIRRSKVNEKATITDDQITIDLPKPIPLFIHTDRQLKFDSVEAVKGLEENIREIKPKLVIIDPLYAAASTEDYMRASVEQMSCLKDFRDKYGVTFVLAHHTNKGGATADRQRAWGSQFLNAFLETSWQVYGKGEASIKIQRTFKAAQKPPETCISFDINTDTDFRYNVVQGLAEDTEELEPNEEVDLSDSDEDLAKEIEAEPTVVEMDEADRQEQLNTKGPRVLTNEAIIRLFMAPDVRYLSQREVANLMKCDLANTTRKLDKMVEAGKLICKHQPRKRPGWKKTYRLNF